jgi:hypothetical protein
MVSSSSSLEDLFAQLPQISVPNQQQNDQEDDNEPAEVFGSSEEKALALVQDGDVLALKKLFQETPELHVNRRLGSNGRALLHEACACGQREVTQFLLQETSADMNLQTMLVSSVSA